MTDLMAPVRIVVHRVFSTDLLRIYSRQEYTDIAQFPLNFRNEIPWLCSGLFPDPSQVQVLVYVIFESTPPSLHWLLSITIL